MCRVSMLSLAIAAFGVSVPATYSSAAETHNPAQTGASGAPANAIVGLWGTEALVGPCGQTPTSQVRNTLLFHAGGTVVENPLIPPAGVPNVGLPGNYQRGQALGTWTFDPALKTYQIYLRFDNYVDNAYQGYSTVDRQITLLGRDQAYGPVKVARFNPEGTVIVELCGEAYSTRL